MSNLDPIKLLAAGFSKAEIVAMMSGKSDKTVNTKKSVYAPTSNRDLNSALQSARAKFRNEPLVELSVARPYGKLTGGYLNLGINGSVIEVPCDGATYKVPKSFKALAVKKLFALDESDSEQGASLGSTEVSTYLKQGGLISGATTVKVADIQHG